METDLASLPGALVLKARVRADRIIPWAGMGNPAGAMGDATLTLRFTKRLRGKVSGLCFIRDLYPAGILTTKVEILQEGQLKNSPRTDAQRYYRSAVLLTGPYRMEAVVQDGASASHRVFLVELGLRNREVARAHGRARTWDLITELPIAEALLVSAQTGQLDAGGVTESNATGFYALILGNHNSASTGYYLQADAEDFTEEWLEGLVMPDQTVLDVDLPLGYAGALEGIVRGHTNDPLAGAVVQASLTPTSGKSPWQAVTDVNGYYVIYDLDAPRTYELIADHPQGATALIASHAIPAASQKHAISSTRDITLSQPGEQSGRVHDSSDQGIPDVEVNAVPTAGPEGWGRQSTVTDANGAYTLSDLNPGYYTIGFDAPGYEPVDQLVHIASGTMPPLNVLLPVIGLILGEVRDSGGTTLDQAWITAKQATPNTDGYAFALCQTGGVYNLGLPAAGTYEVTAEAVGFSPSPQTVTVAYGGTESGVDFSLQPLP